MQCIRGVSNGGGAASAVERKILIKTEDSRGVANGDGVSVAQSVERRSGQEGAMEECHLGQVGSVSDDKKLAALPEVRTFVISENQCIVYGARTGGGSEGSRPTAPTTPPSLPSSTLQQLPISHLPPKKTLKLTLGLRGPISPPAATTTTATMAAPRQPSPPPLTLRRTSEEPDRMMARIQIVSKAHQHPCDDGQPLPVQNGVVVGGGGGQGVHVIRDGRFYQPAAAQQQRHEDSRCDVKQEEDRQDTDHVVMLEEGTRGSYRSQQQHTSIIVTNGSRNSPPITHQGRVSPAGSGSVLQHPHTSSSNATTTTILVSNERASSYKPPTQATSTTTTTVSSSKQQHQQQQHSSNNHHQHGHVTSMQPPPPPPPLKMSKGGQGGHEEPSSSMPDLAIADIAKYNLVMSRLNMTMNHTTRCGGVRKRNGRWSIQHREGDGDVVSTYTRHAEVFNNGAH
uniref:Uncharacterized protein n=1 Tax=Anopheles culicifacies TaxID=139723 RepID=A0A182MD16_9DIPT